MKQIFQSKMDKYQIYSSTRSWLGAIWEKKSSNFSRRCHEKPHWCQFRLLVFLIFAIVAKPTKKPMIFHKSTKTKSILKFEIDSELLPSCVGTIKHLHKYTNTHLHKYTNTQIHTNTHNFSSSFSNLK